MVYFSKPLRDEEILFEMHIQENPMYRHMVFSELDKDYSDFNCYVLDSLV